MTKNIAGIPFSSITTVYLCPLCGHNTSSKAESDRHYQEAHSYEASFTYSKTDLCWWSPSKRCLIDVVVLRSDGALVSHFSKKLFEDELAEYPDLRQDNIDDAIQKIEESWITEPEETTEEDYDYMLNVLPPINWRQGQGMSSFMMSEMMSGNITNIYVCDRTGITPKYFTFLDRVTITHSEIVQKVSNFQEK